METLSEIRKRIEPLSEDGRFLVWMSLYSSQEMREKNTLDEMIRDPDPYLRLLFIRFLASVPEERSIEFLLKTLEDSNTVIQNASIRAFEKNGWGYKWAKLMGLARSLNQTAQFYALEKLAQAVVLDAIPVLLSMLATKDEKLLVHILKGLRYFSDERIYPSLLPFLYDPREEIRFRSVMAVGALYEAEVRGARAPFLRALKDLSPQIRRGVLWGLCRRPLRQDLKEILLVAEKDQDPMVREAAVTSLSFFQTDKVASFLVGLLAAEKEKNVLLKAEGVLNGFSKNLLSSVLWRILWSKKGVLQRRALLLLAEFKDPSGEFSTYLLDQIRKTKDPKETLPILEALGVTEDPRAVPALEATLKGNPLLAYTAIASLLKIWTRYPDCVPVVHYLEDATLTPLLKQTILKQMLKSAKWELYEQKMRPTLLTLLDHDNLNIRYLAAQVVAPVSSPEVLEKCLESVLKETDPAYSRFLKESLQKQLSLNPSSAAPLVQKYRDNKDALSFLFAILQETKLFGKDLIELLRSILMPPISFHQSGHEGLLGTLITSFLLEKRLPLDDFFAEIEHIPGREALLTLLADVIKKCPDLDVSIPIDRLEKWFPEETASSRQAIIDLAGFSKDRMAIGFLVSLACREEMKDFRERAAQGVRELMGRV